MDSPISMRDMPLLVSRKGPLLDRDLMKLTAPERYGFLVFLSLLLIISIIGNIATIFCNIIQKKRPMYQACLLSLAVSDLLTAVFSGAGYINRLSKEMSLLWDLGELMCSLIPFASVCAILASSVTLTAIALDRYQAIVRALKDNWEPGGCFSAASVIIVWSLAAGVSSPMWTSSAYFETYVILTDPNNATAAVGVIMGALCSSDLEMKKANMIFFTIVFSVIFLPLLIVFLWLYTVVAREVWVRRKPVSPNNAATETSADTETSTVSRRNISESAPNVGSLSPAEERCGNIRGRKRAKDIRMERKVRTFKVILVLMAVFFLCRLPTWIYVIIKHDIQTDNDFLLQLNFNALNLVNTALNPFLYTFLGSTLSFTAKCRRLCKRLWSLCNTGDKSDIDIVNAEGKYTIGLNKKSFMIPRGPYVDESKKKGNFYQANVTEASNKPIMTSGVYLGNGVIDGDQNSNNHI